MCMPKVSRLVDPLAVHEQVGTAPPTIRKAYDPFGLTKPTESPLKVSSSSTSQTSAGGAASMRTNRATGLQL